MVKVGERKEMKASNDKTITKDDAPIKSQADILLYCFDNHRM